ncbi:unnamed protein product, partial [Discosporangium mesarthrocarpum]
MLGCACVSIWLGWDATYRMLINTSSRSSLVFLCLSLSAALELAPCCLSSSEPSCQVLPDAYMNMSSERKPFFCGASHMNNTQVVIVSNNTFFSAPKILSHP